MRVDVPVERSITQVVSFAHNSANQLVTAPIMGGEIGGEIMVPKLRWNCYSAHAIRNFRKKIRATGRRQEKS